MFESLVETYFEGEERRPPWLNSSLLGGGLVFAMTLGRNGGIVGIGVATVAAVYRFGPVALLWIPGVLLLAVGAGMVGGLAYGLLRPLRRAGVMGGWISWTVGISVYGFTVLGVLQALGLSGGMSLNDPVVWKIMAGLAAVYAGFMAWASRPDSYVSGSQSGAYARAPYVPLSAEQRRAVQKAAARRLWEGTEARLRQREEQYRGYEARPEEHREAARLLHDQLADLDRTEHALRRSIGAQGSGDKELAALVGWRDKLRAKLDDFSAA